MKTLELNISERIFVFGILSAFQGNEQALETVSEDVKKVQVTEEDWKTAKRIIVTRSGKEFDSVESYQAYVKELADKKLPEDPGATWRWDDIAGGIKPVELERATVNYLLETINKKDSNKEYTLQDKAVLTLRTKLISK